MWESTICRIVHECLDVFYEHFVTQHIYLPSQRQAEKEAQLMHKCSGFPPIAWASVDGTYVKIRCPVIEEALYNCRKFFHALNGQAHNMFSQIFQIRICEFFLEQCCCKKQQKKSRVSWEGKKLVWGIGNV